MKIDILSINMLKRQHLRKSFFLPLLIIALPLIFAAQLLAADGTPPTTSINLEGTAGNNGWYISTVNVSLQAIDLETGPASTTYWINSDPPTTVNYSTSANAIQNPSFEDGFSVWPTSWDDSGGALFYRSALVSKFGLRSGAIASAINTGYYYWTNRNYYVPTTEGQNYTVTAWVKTLDLFAKRGAWFEIWARQASGGTDILVDSSDKVWGTSGWVLLSKPFVAPSGYDGVYVKLGMEDAGGIGFAWWDGVTLNAQLETKVDFAIVENGNHTVSYYSTDVGGNTENTNTTNVKIDTNAPGTWNDFLAPGCGNNHSYIGSVNAEDPISGIATSSAQYRYYTNHHDLGWSDWANVASVKLESNGQPASNGETNTVVMSTPCIDFGDSSTVFRVQFRVSDMAGNLSNSPIYTIEGPWMQLGNGEVYAQNGISMTASTPTGQTNANDTIIIGNTTLDSFTTSANRTMTNYTYTNDYSLANLIPHLNTIQGNAIALPQNNLPITSGIYSYNGNYTIDNQTITNGFKNNQLAAIILINGNLRIKKSYTMNTNSAVIFIVSGNVEVEGGVENMSGLFVGSGYFDSNIDNKIKPKQLMVNGGVAMQGNILLNRDLGRSGNPSNDDTPAEYFSIPLTYYLNQQMARLLNGSSIDAWQEK